MQALLHSPHLGGLKLLNIAYTELDPAIATQLADPNILPGLEKLVVSYDDKKYGSLLRPRFGKELYFGSLEREEGFGTSRMKNNCTPSHPNYRLRLPAP